jgi:Cd2+/Zn2+-exporting ATPase
MDTALNDKASSESSCGCQACGTVIVSGLSKKSGREPLPEGVSQVKYSITNMDCPVEERIIRDLLEGKPGIVGLEFNLIKRVLTIRHTLDSLKGVEDALISADMPPVLIEGSSAKAVVNKTHAWKKLVVASVLALSSELAHLAGLHEAVPIVLAVVAIFLAGFSTYKKGWISIRHLDLNMNALMSFAVTGAVIIGDYSEAAMVMVLFTLAEALEDRSLNRAREAITGLMSLAPEKATILNPDGTVTEINASETPIGSILRVKPGEKLSLDGKIVKGSSTINEAAITGESMPVEKGEGATVFAGTVNEAGSFDYEVTEAFEDSTLSRILQAV